jgi:hypothetical protein
MKHKLYRALRSAPPPFAPVKNFGCAPGPPKRLLNESADFSRSSARKLRDRTAQYDCVVLKTTNPYFRNRNLLMTASRWPSPRGRGSIPGQYVWDLWWK